MLAHLPSPSLPVVNLPDVDPAGRDVILDADLLGLFPPRAFMAGLAGRKAAALGQVQQVHGEPRWSRSRADPGDGADEALGILMAGVVEISSAVPRSHTSPRTSMISSQMTPDRGDSMMPSRWRLCISSKSGPGYVQSVVAHEDIGRRPRPWRSSPLAHAAGLLVGYCFRRFSGSSPPPRSASPDAGSPAPGRARGCGWPPQLVPTVHRVQAGHGVLEVIILLPGRSASVGGLSTSPAKSTSSVTRRTSDAQME